jgi:hypothetical protein
MDDVMPHELFVKPLRKMNESTPKPTGNLSLAAQAVLIAYRDNRPHTAGMAAALRALTQELKYIGITEKNILAIADELEGLNG